MPDRTILRYSTAAGHGLGFHGAPIAVTMFGWVLVAGAFGLVALELFAWAMTGQRSGGEIMIAAGLCLGFGAPAALLKQETVIDRDRGVVVSSFGLLSLRRSSAHPLSGFDAVELSKMPYPRARQEPLITYLVRLTGPAGAVAVFESKQGRWAKTVAKEVAGTLGLRLVDRAA
ncbi:MAG: hypothetical protein HY815_01620 [Candidatus Riflebacteria bacterium]|nr:hypothetical protein [Candidatus Riflebacteria bacterium]